MSTIPNLLFHRVDSFLDTISPSRSVVVCYPMVRRIMRYARRLTLRVQTRQRKWLWIPPILQEWNPRSRSRQHRASRGARVWWSSAVLGTIMSYPSYMQSWYSSSTWRISPMPSHSSMMIFHGNYYLSCSTRCYSRTENTTGFIVMISLGQIRKLHLGLCPRTSQWRV